jgi:hypothetical protein
MKSRWSGLFAISMALVACGSPKVGDPCTQLTCLDKTRALECREGTYRDIPCPGPEGCFTRSGTGVILFECDTRNAKSDDGCALTWTSFVQCQGNTQALICNGTLWSQQPCKSCQDTQQSPNDASVVVPGLCE